MNIANTPGLAMFKTVNAPEVPAASPISFQKISAKSFSPQNGTEFVSYNTVILDGKITIPNKGPVTGYFDYVVTMDNKLKIGQGHFNLSEGASEVQAAGGLSIKNGVVKMQNNSSGLYRPTPLQGVGSDIVLQLLGIKTRGLGVNTIVETAKLRL